MFPLEINDIRIGIFFVSKLLLSPLPWTIFFISNDCCHLFEEKLYWFLLKKKNRKYCICDKYAKMVPQADRRQENMDMRVTAVMKK